MVNYLWKMLHKRAICSCYELQLTVISYQNKLKYYININRSIRRHNFHPVVDLFRNYFAFIYLYFDHCIYCTYKGRILLTSPSHGSCNPSLNFSWMPQGSAQIWHPLAPIIITTILKIIASGHVRSHIYDVIHNVMFGQNLRIMESTVRK